MQDCFRKYPEVYGEEIAEEEAAETEAAAVALNSHAPPSESKDVSKDATAAPAPAAQPKEKPMLEPKPKSKPQQAAASTHEFSTEEHKAGPTDAPKEPRGIGADAHAKVVSEGEDERGIPKRSFDATSANASASK